MNSKSHFAYFAVQNKQGNQKASAFAIGDEPYIRGVLDKWDRGGEATIAESDSYDEAPDFTHESALTDALSSAVSFGLSQYQLILVSGVLPNTFPALIAREQIIAPAERDAELLEENDSSKLYGISEDQYLFLIKQREALTQMRDGIAALPSATLMSIVSTFDTLIVDILSKMLRLDPSWLNKSEKTFPISKLSESGSIGELIQEAISDELYQFSRGSHDEQARYIETNFGISIKKFWKRWPDYIEVFERRNLIAHGEPKFNRRYVSICKNAGHKGSDKVFDQPIELTPIYLTQALDILIEFSVLLPFSLWRKLVQEKEEQAFSNLNEAAFKLINNQRYRPAERILEFALGLDKVKVGADTRQRMIVNRASAARHAGDQDKAIQILDEVDWSGTSDIFKICVHSVRGNAKEVANLLAPLKGANALEARSFKQWPCFSFVRNDKMVQQTFEEVFGEPLIRASDNTAVDDGNGDQSADASIKNAEIKDPTRH